MCVSSGAATLFGTTLFAGRRSHPVHGRVEVLGYQNRAVNRAAGPNAMLLHLAAREVTSAQFLSVGRCDRILRDMAAAAVPVPALGRGLGVAPDWMDGGRVEVFEHDIYTVVLAERATDIARALDRVPEHKRPTISGELLEFYADCFPRHPVALCCFDNTEARQAKPLLLWYRPLDEERLVLPAIDCHTGSAPDLRASVRADHTVVLATDRAASEWGEPVRYSQAGQIRHELRAFLPTEVRGERFAHVLPNGDFAIAHDDLIRGDLERIERVTPGH
ncbi:hypothetical protein KDL01_39600 [Actinospica durhamensis]|uniref:Uncharacterized protein n=1 Tax=Actinospica durhamensis TaxID=1508375 RepID=A0A941EWG1_9ACTN|nr:hypothetical protein [Actinospica durhamensis]MBR7839432.1 hypothetical protein [Actinospica durhamensis]